MDFELLKRVGYFAWKEIRPNTESFAIKARTSSIRPISGQHLAR
jgi:hypothetical protein